MGSGQQKEIIIQYSHCVILTRLTTALEEFFLHELKNLCHKPIRFLGVFELLFAESGCCHLLCMFAGYQQMFGLFISVISLALTCSCLYYKVTFSVLLFLENRKLFDRKLYNSLLCYSSISHACDETMAYNPVHKYFKLLLGLAK